MSLDDTILVCLHDVSPRHAERVQRIDELLGTFGLRGRYSMLVVPDFWSEWPLDEHPEFVAWLRERADEGVEMILHGYTHKDETEHTSAIDRWKSTSMTAREGEFLGLSESEAERRLVAGRTMLEGLLDTEIRSFVAPAWLYSRGAHAALEKLGFTIAESHSKVWSPTTGRVMLRGPVLGYASRDAQRIASSMTWSRIATTALRPAKVVRLAIHPHDFDVPMLEREIGRALTAFLSRRRPLLYHELAAA